MIRKLISASALLLTLTIIPACGKEVETSSISTTSTDISSELEESATSSSSEPEASATSLSADTVDMQDDNINIHASVIIPDVCKEGSAFTAVGSALDLVSDIEALQSDFVPSAVEPVIEINPDNPGLFSIMSQDENSWTALGYNESGDFVLNSKLFGLYRNCIVTTPGIVEHNADLYQNKPDLNFMSLNDAVKEVQTVLSRYNICLGDVVNAYTLDHQTMQQELDTTDAMGENDPELQSYNWTDTDDAYYFFFHQSYNGIPMMNNMYRGQGFTPGEDAIVMISQKGIIGFAIKGCYRWSEQETVSVIPAAEAADSFMKNYKGIVGTQYDVNKISLMLDIIPGANMKAELKPVWVLDYTVTGDGYSFNDSAVFDAVSSKEINAG